MPSFFTGIHVKRIIHGGRLITDLVEAKVEDIFIDWNFDKDKSTIIIVTAPVK